MSSPYLYPSAQVLVQYFEQIPSPTTAQPICLVPAVQMSRLPVRVQFHMSVHVVPPTVPILVVLPSLVCAAPVPSRVAPSTHATPSLFPPFFVSLSAFTHFTYCIFASLPLWP